MKFKESEKVEFKKSTAELKEALNDLCAFANSGIGTIYFGVSDKGKVVGQDVSDNTIKKVSITILSLIEPRLYPNVYTQTVDGKEILVVELKNSAEKPYFYKGKAYKRIGTTNVYLSRYEIEKYLYERENPAYRFDKTTIEEYKGGIAARTLKWFLKKAKEERNLPINLSESRDVILSKLGVLTQSKLNFAGLISFGKDIQRYFPDTIVKCALFEGRDKTGRILDHIDIKDNIFNQIDFAENFILRNIRKAAWINPQTGRREEKYELPYLAIREAIANAVAHRDYRISSHIDIAIFDDRIEVWSPGGLPLGITIKDLPKKHMSVLRNPVIAEVLYLSRYIERWATGINKMNRLMREYKLPLPKYEETAGSFVVLFQRQKIVTKVREKSKVQLDEQAKAQVEAQAKAQVEAQVGITEIQRRILSVCLIAPTPKRGIAKKIGHSGISGSLKKNVKFLVDKKLIKYTVPDRPQSSKQKCVITKKGRKLLEEREASG